MLGGEGGAAEGGDPGEGGGPEGAGVAELFAGAGEGDGDAGEAGEKVGEGLGGEVVLFAGGLAGGLVGALVIPARARPQAACVLFCFFRSCLG